MKDKNIMLKTIGRGGFHGLISQLIYLGIIVAFTPFIIKNVGINAFGIYSLFLGFSFVNSFADFGIANGIVNGLSRSTVEDDYCSSGQIVTNGLAGAFLISCLASTIGFFVAVNLPLETLLKIPLSHHHDFRIALIFVFISSWTNFISSFAQKCRIALILPVSLAWWSNGSAIVTLTSVWYLSHMKDALPLMVGAQFLVPSLMGIANFVLLLYRHPQFRPKLKYLQIQRIYARISAGRMYLILQLCALFYLQGDTFIVSHYLGVKSVAIYATTSKIFSVVSGLVMLSVNPLWPRFRHALNSGNLVSIRELLRVSLIVVLSVSSMGCVIVIFWGSFLISKWTSGEIVPSPLLVILSGFWLIELAIAQVFSMLLNAYHAEKFQVVTSISTVVLNIILSILGTKLLRDPGGAVLGSILSWTIFTFLPILFWLSRRNILNLK